MYACGVPMGLLTDNRGPRLTTLIGAVALGVGYFPLHLGMVVSSGLSVLEVC